MININKLKDFKNLIFLVILLILLIANYSVYNKYGKVKKEYEKKFGISKVQEETAQEEQETDEDEEAEELEELKEMEERDRMEFYFSKFIEYIEEEEYQKSYDLLYEGFKDKYFPSLEKFIQYVKNTYPESPGFVYKDIERQGEIYVLKIEIVNYKDKTKNKSQRIVIKENNFNDFVISFQVI